MAKKPSLRELATRILDHLLPYARDEYTAALFEDKVTDIVHLMTAAADEEEVTTSGKS